jgi:hypothetical protein
MYALEGNGIERSGESVYRDIYYELIKFPNCVPCISYSYYLAVHESALSRHNLS